MTTEMYSYPKTILNSNSLPTRNEMRIIDPRCVHACWESPQAGGKLDEKSIPLWVERFLLIKKYIPTRLFPPEKSSVTVIEVIPWFRVTCRLIFNYLLFQKELPAKIVNESTSQKF